MRRRSSSFLWLVLLWLSVVAVESESVLYQVESGLAECICCDPSVAIPYLRVEYYNCSYLCVCDVGNFSLVYGGAQRGSEDATAASASQYSTPPSRDGMVWYGMVWFSVPHHLNGATIMYCPSGMCRRMAASPRLHSPSTSGRASQGAAVVGVEEGRWCIVSSPSCPVRGTRGEEGWGVVHWTGA